MPGVSQVHFEREATNDASAKGTKKNQDAKLSGLLLDWTGTIVDFGCRAPIEAFLQAFEESSVPITESEIRVPMGMAMREHIRAILETPRVEAAWREIYGQNWRDVDVEMIYERFLPLQAKAARRHRTVIPGAVNALRNARERGLMVGSVAGYTSAVMREVMKGAEKQGVVVDTCACSGDTPTARVMPFMLYKVLLELELGVIWRCVVVDDTPIGIEAARNAGAWTVGVVISGNEIGLPRETWMSMSKPDRNRLRKSASKSLRAAGAHFVIDTIGRLPAVLTRLEDRLARGERP